MIKSDVVNPDYFNNEMNVADTVLALLLYLHNT